MLRRRKWILLQTVILVPAVAVGLSLRLAPTYEASAEVVLKYQNLAGLLTGIQDVSTGSQNADRVAKTQARVARAPELAARVLEAVGLSDRSPRELLSASTVSPDTGGSDVLEFTVRDGDATTARVLASAYARQYIRYRREVDTEPIIVARQGLTERINELRRDGRQDSALYDRLVENEQQLKTMEALQTANASVLRLPDQASKVSPNPIRNGILGLLLGIVVGIGLASLREALDTRVRSVDAVAAYVRAPLLARLPEPPRKRRQKSSLVMLNDPEGAHAEAFRLLRTNIEFANVDRGLRTIMVTSATEGEGKSTTVANLGIAFARMGRTVAVVDLDLRRPTLDVLFGVKDSSFGVVDVALGYVRLEQALVHIPIDGAPTGNGSTPSHSHGDGRGERTVAILPAGQSPPDPGEFVNTSAVRRVLRALQDQFDVVLIDVPPLLGVGDALTLSAEVTGVILVTKLEVLRRGMLRELETVLRNAPATVLGFAVTGAQPEQTYGSGYYTDRRPASRASV